jgi:hypothetical protein
MTPAERRARKNAKDRERRAAIKTGTWAFPMNGDAAKANGGNYARRARRKAEAHSGSPAAESSAPSQPPDCDPEVSRPAECATRPATPGLLSGGAPGGLRGAISTAFALIGVTLTWR